MKPNPYKGNYKYIILKFKDSNYKNKLYEYDLLYSTHYNTIMYYIQTEKEYTKYYYHYIKKNQKLKNNKDLKQDLNKIFLNNFKTIETHIKINNTKMKINKEYKIKLNNQEYYKLIKTRL